MQVADWDGGGGNPALLYIGGESNLQSVRVWNGTTGSNVPNAPSGNVYAMTLVNDIGSMPGGLIVGGDFYHLPNPSGGNYVANDLARFNGSSWSLVGNGVGTFSSLSYVNAVRAFGADLYVGGQFTSVGNESLFTNNIARFNGSSWSAVGGGAGTVHELREYNGSLYAGGSFSSVGGGGVDADNIARWNGAAWSGLIEPFNIMAMTGLGSRVIMGGLFSYYTAAFGSTPEINRANIATWDGAVRRGLGWGTNGQILALTAFTSGSGPSASNVIVAGGDFTAAGPDDFGFNITVNRVAQYIEPSLTFPHWAPMGSGFNNSVHALERFNGNTVAGGAFTLSGATSVNRLAKYVGSAWQPLTTTDPGLNGTVRALKSFTVGIAGGDSYLAIGGDFTSAPGAGVAALRILQRKESFIFGDSAWQPLGSGFNNSVYAIERHGSGLSARTYAAGSFTASGATTLNRIARWNGTAWEAVGIGGAGGGFNGTVYALKSTGQYLFAAGAFTSVDGVPVNRVAKWNGSVWSDASGGANNTVFALQPYQTELIAGGMFTKVESNTLDSPGMARLHANGSPWILNQPLSQTRDCDETVYFSVQVPEGYPNVSYQWRKDGVPLSDGPTGSGSEAYFSHSASIEIWHLSPDDNGVYDCVVTNACGSAISLGATLTVGTCCAADVAPAPIGDDVVNVSDLLAVINGWGACTPPCPPTCAADVDDNCMVNVTDLLAVINAWGPCP